MDSPRLSSTASHSSLSSHPALRQPVASGLTWWGAAEAVLMTGGAEHDTGGE